MLLSTVFQVCHNFLAILIVCDATLLHCRSISHKSHLLDLFGDEVLALRYGGLLVRVCGNIESAGDLCDTLEPLVVNRVFAGLVVGLAGGMYSMSLIIYHSGA
jgi:hypothetical protein